MKKEPTRDYVTEIFRTWAEAGMPTYEEARERIYEEALRAYSHTDAATAAAQAELAAKKRTPLLLDILAAETTMELLEKSGKDMIARAVKEVYFVCPSKPPRRGEIVERVRRFSVTCPADTRTVYRWLKEARLLCAAVRGLRVPEGACGRYRFTP